MSVAPGDTPPRAEDIYTARSEALAQQGIELRRRDRIFGVAKLIAAVITIAVALWLARLHAEALGWALVPALVFAGLWIAHERLLRRLRNTEQLRSYYERGIARLNDAWTGTGDDGLRFFSASHPYARDLDIFGAGSLYQLLSQAASAPGQLTLAQWLLHKAGPAEVAQRQQAVRELAPRLELRERLATVASDIHAGTPAALITWAESQTRSTAPGLPYYALPLAAIWVSALVYWMATGQYQWVVAVGVLNAALRASVYRNAQGAAEQAHQLSPMLAPLHRVLASYEAESFQAPRLLALTQGLRRGALSPSRAIAQLERTLHWLESSDNIFVKLADRFVFWTPLCIFAIERWRSRYGTSMRAWLTSVGDFEALQSLASFAFEHPDASFPAVDDGPQRLVAKGLAHPLLPSKSAIENDITLDATHPLVIVSGPNMAGKSTLLRAIGLNAVLAQCGAPVCCAALALSTLEIGASIQVQDSLQGGLSRFYAEIQRLKQVTDLAVEQPTLFLLDELLSGTNSRDRRTGTEALVRELLARRAIGLITTHDLALTEIADSLDGRASNVHFGDRFAGGELHFDYRLADGIANSTNALALMRSIGLEV